MLRKVFSKGEAGTTMAEFAVIAGLFFMMTLAIIEFGRLLYTHNALTDAARRGARYAVVHKAADIACVKNVVVYGETHVDPDTCAATGSALIKGLTTSNITVTYAGVGASAYGPNVGTVTVSITSYTFTLSIPFASKTLTMPAYTSTLTAESAGQ